MHRGDEEFLDMVYNIEAVMLKRNLRSIFKNHWAPFKQINMKNFLNVGSEYANTIGDGNLKDIVTFLANTYIDWIKFLSAKNESHYDGSYAEFEKYLFTPQSFFSQNHQDGVILISVLYSHQPVQDVIASTFAFEHPDIVEDWKKKKTRKTALQKYFYEKNLSNN